MLLNVFSLMWLCEITLTQLRERRSMSASLMKRKREVEAHHRDEEEEDEFEGVVEEADSDSNAEEESSGGEVRNKIKRKLTTCIRKQTDDIMLTMRTSSMHWQYRSLLSRRLR
jgi:hypothetical protein